METAAMGGMAGFQYIAPNHIIKTQLHWKITYNEKVTTTENISNVPYLEKKWRTNNNLYYSYLSTRNKKLLDIGWYNTNGKNCRYNTY